MVISANLRENPTNLGFLLSNHKSTREYFEEVSAIFTAVKRTARAILAGTARAVPAKTVAYKRLKFLKSFTFKPKDKLLKDKLCTPQM